MLQPGRKNSGGSGYRYGFNGKENDKDITSGDLDFGGRIYDSRLSRWLSVDPLFKKFEKFSPYNFCVDNPLVIIDYDGRDIIDFIKHIKESSQYKIASSFWTKTATFNTTLARFANINANDDAKNLGYTKNGDLSNVRLEFNKIDNSIEAKEDFQGRTQLMVKTKTGWVDLLGYQGDFNALNPSDMKVVMTFSEFTGFGDKLGLGNHELLIHAEKEAELINSLQKGEITMAQFKEETDILFKGNYGHVEASNGFNNKLNTAHKELTVIVQATYPVATALIPSLGDQRTNQGTKGAGGIVPAINRDGYITIYQALATFIASDYQYMGNRTKLTTFKTKEEMKQYYDKMRSQKPAPTPAPATVPATTN